VREQVSHPCKTKSKTIVLNILILLGKFLKEKCEAEDSELNDIKHSPNLMYP
jgi:hypothetical protein